MWEKRFEHSYGFWRELVEDAVARYLDCGIWDLGSSRVKCRESPEEHPLAFSCKGRGGVNLNLVTKSGSNVFRGSGRFFIVDKAIQSDNITGAGGPTEP